MPTEFERVEYLLGKSKVQGIDALEGEELRNYIIREYPAATKFSMEEIIKLGLLMVGVRLLKKEIYSGNSNEPG